MKPETFLPDDYRPAEDEPFMNDRQLEYFRRKLIAWKNDILAESRDTIEALQEAMKSDDKVEGNTPLGTFSGDSIQADLQNRTVRLQGNAHLRIAPKQAKGQ